MVTMSRFATCATSWPRTASISSCAMLCNRPVDTAVFWGIAFAGSDLPWITWAVGDLAVKLAVGVLMLLPFRLLIGRSLARAEAAAANT